MVDLVLLRHLTDWKAIEVNNSDFRMGMMFGKTLKLHKIARLLQTVMGFGKTLKLHEIA